MKNKLIVSATSKSYPIYFKSGILNSAGELIKKNIIGVKKICIITDNKLPNFLLKKLTKSLKKYDLKIYKLKTNEKTKSFKIANRIIEDLLKLSFKSFSMILFATLRLLVFSFADSL